MALAAIADTKRSSADGTTCTDASNNNNLHGSHFRTTRGPRYGFLRVLLPVLVLTCVRFIMDTRNIKRVNYAGVILVSDEASASTTTTRSSSSSTSSVSAVITDANNNNNNNKNKTMEKKKKTARSNNNNETDLVLWIPEKVMNLFDSNFTVSEKGTKKHVLLSNVMKFELRKCTTTSISNNNNNNNGNNNGNNSSNATTTNPVPLLPACPTRTLSKEEESNDHQNTNNTNKMEVVGRKTVNLIICYGMRDKNIQKNRLLQKEDVVAVTTTGPNPRMVLHQDIVVQRGGNCAKECDNFEGEEDAPYMYDTIDHLCKSTDPAALPPKRGYGGSCSCITTCFTPEVGDPKSTYPWKSHDEYNFYHEPPLPLPPSNTSTATATGRERRMAITKWKQKRASERYRMRFLCKTKQNNNETSSSVGEQQQQQQTQESIIDMPGAVYAAFAHHLYFIPEGKLIFCGIPKAGITEWIKFFRFVIGAKDYLSIPHWKEDTGVFLMSSLTLEKATELLSDPTWTKAMFVRDPAERLLSAYSNKVAGGDYTQSYFEIHNGTRGTFKETKWNPHQYVLSFPEFVDLIAYNNRYMKDPRGLHGLTDPHWRPQSMMCGMDYLLPHLDFIGSFEHVGEHTKLLLEKVGLWEKYGSKFDPADDLEVPGSICSKPPPHRAANYTPLGFNQRGPTSTTGHTTNSKSKLDQYYTPEMIEQVRKAYVHDYAIWDELKGRAADDVLSGSDLSIVKNKCGGGA